MMDWARALAPASLRPSCSASTGGICPSTTWYRPFSVSDLFADPGQPVPNWANLALGPSHPISLQQQLDLSKEVKKVIIWGQGGEIINPPVDHGRRCTSDPSIRIEAVSGSERCA